MEPPLNYESQVDVGSSDVIIIDPSTFSKKKVVHTIIKPKNGKFKSTPLDKDIKPLKLTAPHVPTTMKTLEEPIQKTAKLLFPSLDDKQNRKIQEIRRNQLHNYQSLPNQNKQPEQQYVGTTQSTVQLNQKPLVQFKPVCPTRTPLIKYIEFINEALFDDGQLTKKQDISVDDSDNEVLEFEEQTLEYVLEKPRTNSVATQVHIAFITNGVQTEEPSEDRINCGFVNVSKIGDEKYFNLRCFYCDAEFPISFWSEFSDHIIGTHGDLEKVYNENDAKSVSDVQSLNDETNIFHDGTNIFNEPISIGDTEVEENPPEKLFLNLVDKDRLNYMIIKEPDVKELLPEDFDYGNDWDSCSDEEPYYMSAESYEVYLEHCYSRSKIISKNKSHAKPKTDRETIDQISFENTSYIIVMDFLEHLKGFPSLWQDSNLNIERYNNELQDLMAIMTEKWSLHLKKSVLRKNVENIKAWFVGMTEAKEGRSYIKFTKKYIDYYTKCAEYMPFGDLKKSQKVYCDICKRFCFDAIGLQIHKYRKHNIGQLPYACNMCDKRFDYIHKLRGHLQRHMVIESGSQPEIEAICAECEKKFTDSHEFQKHLEIHTKGNCHFVCDVCGFRSRTAGILNHHKKRHQERIKKDVTHICEECGFRCNALGLLNAHRKRHREPTFQCELCPKKFHFSHHLKKHMTTHKRSYDYVCESCGKLFIRKTYLMDHVKYMHMGYGFCKICNRVYGKQCIFVKHLRTQHRPLIGSIEELTRRHWVNKNGENIGRSSGPRLKCRKYTYVVDPVTNKRTLKCPKCDKCYNQYDSLYSHYKKVHGSTVPGYTRRLTGNQKLVKNRKRNYVRTFNAILADPNVEAAETAAAVDTIMESPDIKSYSLVSQNNRISNYDEFNTTYGKTAVENAFEEFQDMTPISYFEKFVNEMYTIKDCAPNTANQPETTQKSNLGTGIKIESSLTDFEFLLNNSSP